MKYNQMILEIEKSNLESIFKIPLTYIEIENSQVLLFYKTFKIGYIPFTEVDGNVVYEINEFVLNRLNWNLLGTIFLKQIMIAYFELPMESSERIQDSIPEFGKFREITLHQDDSSKGSQKFLVTFIKQEVFLEKV